MQTKYIVIRLRESELIFTFPGSILHADMFDAVLHIREGTWTGAHRPYAYAEIVSAGFVSSAGECFGESKSLGVESRGSDDAALLGLNAGVKA